MTENHDTPERLTLVAIDLAKHYHGVLIEPPGPRRRVRLRLANRREDFEHFAGYLRGLRSSILIGFEATGNYHRPLAYFLHRQGFQLRLIPTLALAAYAGGHAQLLGQERSERRSGNSASAEDRLGADLARPAGTRHQ